MSANILIDCLKCGRKIRIPSDSGTIHVTCPACKEQWDWPRPKTYGKGAGRQTGKALFPGISARIKGWWRVAVSRGRFSYAQLAVALAGGIGLGLVLGTQLHLGGKPSAAPPPESVSILAAPTTEEPAATNILNPPGINPKTEEVVPSRLQDLQPKKTGR